MSKNLYFTEKNRNKIEMYARKAKSQHFYDYLCTKIGNIKEVKGRRLAFTAVDTSSAKNRQFSSGSKSEGLNLKGSDIDLMLIDNNFKVYESEREAVQEQEVVLYMDTTDTRPSFTHLHLYTDYNSIYITLRKMLEKHGVKHLLSNVLYKKFLLQILRVTPLNKIHGPCVSDVNETYDFAYSLKCDKWISQAAPWISRPRSSWLSPEIISKITMTGVLFVPVGLKGSINEEVEWRMSFSVAEKILIFSFNHTQLLCYALLKILLKEIIEKDIDLKGVLCSYYLKTLMFWISDDSDPTIWRRENIIQCFMACLQRLLYCVEYLSLLHYFIPDYNFFDTRLKTHEDIEKMKKLSNLLKTLYQQGIQCFSVSESLHDYTVFQKKTCITKQSDINTRLFHDVFQIFCSCRAQFKGIGVNSLMKSLLRHSQSSLSHDIFLYIMSRAFQYAQPIHNSYNIQNNKLQYCKYKYDLSRLLIGLHSDAVAGWLTLASFFYVYEQYSTSLEIINYALSKYTDEKCKNLFLTTTRAQFTAQQKYALRTMESEKLLTIFKSQTINYLQFACMSQIIPKEIQRDVSKKQEDFHPLSFAHFLRFLCFFHQRDTFSRVKAMQQLMAVSDGILSKKENWNFISLRSWIFVGIAEQLLGHAVIAKDYFTIVAKYDNTNFTTAEKRLHELLFST